MSIPETLARAENQKLPLLERYRRPVDSFLKSFLDQHSGLAKTMITYHLGFEKNDGTFQKEKSDGKALRPTLCLLTVDALAGEWEKAVPAAAAIELLHNFTLIHDDILDSDEKRHGKPTVWSLWGKEQAINAGDIAASVSSLAILELRHQGYSPEKVLSAAQLLFQTGINVLNGQILDIGFEGRLDVSLDEYLDMISRKTGALIETSILLGADLADVDQVTRAHLQQYAQCIGRAFQISDDVLGVWGNEQETGKSASSDIIRRKQSLPVALAFNVANPIQAERLHSIYSQNKETLDQGDIEVILDIFDEMNIKERVYDELLKQYLEAVASIESCDLGDATPDFVQIAELLSFRKK